MMFDLDLSESYKSRSNMFLSQTTTVLQYFCLKENTVTVNYDSFPAPSHVYNEGKSSSLPSCELS